MPVRTGADRLAGLIPPFIHSFLKMPYPEADGIRYFCAPACGGQPTQKGTAERLSPGGIAADSGLPPGFAKSYVHKRCRASPPRGMRREWAQPLPKPCNKACAHRVAGLLPRVPSHLLRKKGQPYGCPLGVSVLGRIRAPCSGSPSDGGSGGLQTALPVYFPPASCRPPGRSHGWQPPGQSPSHG